MIQSRYYKVNGRRLEARFFRKNEVFPGTTDLLVPRQGVWARDVREAWNAARFIADSWRFVEMDLDVLFLPERIR
jgi:hypothetical protein